MFELYKLSVNKYWWILRAEYKNGWGTYPLAIKKRKHKDFVLMIRCDVTEEWNESQYTEVPSDETYNTLDDAHVALDKLANVIGLVRGGM